MAEKPIFFNGEMVRAILDGRKTQTRRPVKWPVMSRSDGSKQRVFIADDAAEMNQLMRERQRHPLLQIKSPYALGDLLYVRETWRVGAWSDDLYFAIDYQADGHSRREWLSYPGTWEERAIKLAQQSFDDAEKALGPTPSERYRWEPGESPCRWRPSIHMPKWAARIWLRVTGVRVERVKDITAESAMAEGAQRFEGLPPSFMGTTDAKWSMGSPKNHGECLGSARMAFANVWCATYGHDSWDRNDWVWVYEFERTEAPR